MAKAPDPRRVAAQRRKEAADEIRWVVDVDGKEHTFRLSDMTAIDVGALRREAQFTLSDMVVGADNGELDAQAALVWMARRQAGEANLSYADVADETTVGQLIWVREENGPEPDEGASPDPPPSGGSSGG